MALVGGGTINDAYLSIPCRVPLKYLHHGTIMTVDKFLPLSNMIYSVYTSKLT